MSSESNHESSKKERTYKNGVICLQEKTLFLPINTLEINRRIVKLFQKNIKFFFRGSYLVWPNAWPVIQMNAFISVCVSQSVKNRERDVDPFAQCIDSPSLIYSFDCCGRRRCTFYSNCVQKSKQSIHTHEYCFFFFVDRRSVKMCIRQHRDLLCVRKLRKLCVCT